MTKKPKMPISHVENIDCMEFMKTFPDKHFNLAIVDPPYGIGESQKKRENTISDKWKSPPKKIHNPKGWDDQSPNTEYFKELQRVSQNQIIWGANHFIQNITEANSSCWIVWDKLNGENDFADCELAWASFDTAVRKFNWLWNGFQKQRPEGRIHPTQKPVALYKWLLKNYAKEGDKILDTHGGSMSSVIAALDMGFEIHCCELDTEYYLAAKKRIESFLLQTNAFQETPEIIFK